MTSGEEVLAESTLPPGREHLENLAILIKNLMDELKIKMKQVAGFAVAIGPGSFSGIRIGLATIKGIALALNKPIVGIPSLEILAWQSLEEGEYGAALIDARRSEFYVGAYEKKAGRLWSLNEPFLEKSANLAEYLRKLPTPLVISGDPAVDSAIRSTALSAKIKIIVPSAATCSILGWKRLIQNRIDDLHSISPIYIRRSDAEEKRRPAQKESLLIR